MKVTFLLLVVFVSVGHGQSIRMTKVSPIYNVEVHSGECGADDKCGPITVELSRKGSRSIFQTITAGRIPKSDIATSIEFVDLDFDGVRDLSVFDGFEGTGGYITLGQRIYVYSKKDGRFVFNTGISEISRRENLASFELDKRRKLIYTHARPGGGVFQMRGYKFVKGTPVLMYETIDDATFADGTKTKLTTRRLIIGRWRTWTKVYKGPLN